MSSEQDSEKTMGSSGSPLSFHLGELERLSNFVSLCLSGLQNGTLLTIIEEEIKSASKYTGIQVEDSVERRRRKTQLEEFSKSEETLGFPYVFSVGTIQLWSILESMVDDFALHFLKKAECRTFDSIRRIKGPLMEFIAASEEEQAEYLLAQLKQDLGVAFKPGLARFEAILETIEMSGPVRDEVKRAILELSQVRNVFVHRKGLADARLTKLCPWLGVQLGDKVRISESQFQAYGRASYWYLVELDARACIRLAMDESRISFRRQMQDRLLDSIRNQERTP